MADVTDMEEELVLIDSEMKALEIQIQELVEKQQALQERKQRLNKKIKKLTGDYEAGSSTAPGASAEDWDKKDFPWSQKVGKTLKDVFKLQSFRPLQLQAINVTMAGKDLFLIMPTGGGKSLCYELPAVCSTGFTLVICPLISLMEDQLMILEQLNIPSTMVNSNSTKEHVKWVHDEMLNKSSKLKLLYVTPEKIAKSKVFMSKLEKAYQAGCLTRIAVDEVHCCSQWGHDFRPDYKSLGILKRQFPNVPLMGLTATATSDILEDVKKILCVPKGLTFTASFNRPNLFYEIRQKPSSFEACIEDMVRIINSRYKGESGIIYCFSQKDTEQVTMSLQKLGIAAGCYHANMEATAKSKVHKDWSLNIIKVVVATVAFGMGIDKADVRFVFHQSLSKSMENYYQESGRAGRDDLKADCILYYGFMDIFRQSTMVVMENVGQQKLYEMVAYCQDSRRCRRVQIAQHFDEVWESTKCNKMCDNCNCEASLEKIDITGYSSDLIKILKHAEQLEEKLTPLKLIEAWNGKGPSKLRLSSVSPPNLSRHEMEDVIVHLLLQEYLKEEFSFTAFATISYLKVAPKANLLSGDKHVVSMHMRMRTNKMKSPAEEVPEVKGAKQKECGNKRSATETVTGNKKSRLSKAQGLILD
ncbi:ATP-dependent DNA helicase Q1 [Pristis pectinata]|uniref:ATP-dependent DNA helicase Q1 n=1 Tax=Pristis pectinata TaxID=685728 RepID=UPI00223E56AB|nr:ATP-dependent DNA helicase Q1 [Pristis pectinata]XP_051889616.1 ATP-dependent DNA helicase Q1 [Pristis pectinata]XP_051889617.1 ATP-dependent DNA helicase Q1 [Pristis pectinata]